MKTKITLVKKADRTVPVEADVAPDPREWSTAVKSWVKEFKKDRDDEVPAEAFDNLFTDVTPAAEG